MLKRFFVSMLGTVAGIWISILIILFGGIVLVGAVIGSKSETVKIKDKSILYIKLEGDIAERLQEQSFMDLVRDYESKGETLDQMLTSVRMAAKDKKIRGIYIDAAGASMGVASRQELVEALNEFKESGKWIYAYADNFSQGDYLVASVADKIFINPVGNVDIRGIGMQTPFFAGLLDKLGIKVQVVKVGTYKSAVEPFILTSMSEPARRQNQVYIDSIWNYYASTIAENRSVEPATVSAWADSLTFAWTASHDVDARIVTETIYRREVEDMLRDMLSVDDNDELPFITPSKYIEANSDRFTSHSDDHIAVLYAVGDIVESGDGGIVGDKMVPEIIRLADDENVAGLVLRVNSGGGSAFASEQIWEALEYFKSQDKPFYVSMGDYAASGGYYISCGADRIYADATTLTGSIGVFGMIPDISGLVTGKLGVTFSTVASSPNATFMSLTSPMTPEQKASMQRYVEETYDIFTSRVAEGRHMSVDSVKAIAEGRVWVGSSALELGLVDELGSLNDAVKAITEEVGLDADAWAAYPYVNTNLLERLLDETSQLQTAQGISLDPEIMKYLVMAKRISEMDPIQARMPEITIR
ncbi:MAG: signal peptide peptidase SppA [Muribaculaceae bacterium]|nr:signal peptide peptidase SppA [Muribaculaceae bacterium]